MFCPVARERQADMPQATPTCGLHSLLVAPSFMFQKVHYNAGGDNGGDGQPKKRLEVNLEVVHACVASQRSDVCNNGTASWGI